MPAAPKRYAHWLAFREQWIESIQDGAFSGVCSPIPEAPVNVGARVLVRPVHSNAFERG
jgi:hypothetical protein